MMREIILDTETTGLDPFQGHRVVEIAAVEVVNKIASGSRFHTYLNPRRDMPEEAFRVHGLSSEFLSDKPVFGAVAADFMAFIAESPIVAHNAEFDMKFLNHELAAAGMPRIASERVVDSLLLARRRHSGASNSLDALCARYNIDASRRTLHGALLDAQLLAEIYLELCGGSQSTFELTTISTAITIPTGDLLKARGFPLDARVAPEELVAHQGLINGLGQMAIWQKYLS